MEIYKSKDNNIVKYLHEDGSETCIKSVPSCSFYYNELTGEVEEASTERNKYSVFISYSVGCPVLCKMCYLSLKKYPYKNIPEEILFYNVIQAIRDYTNDNKEEKSKYIKLCWMGMGDAFYNLKKVYNVTKRLVNTVIEEGLAVGIDSIDIGTTFPKHTEKIMYIELLEDELKRDPKVIINTNNHKSIVRVFYSLHMLKNRNRLIPNALDVDIAIHILLNLKVGVIFHELFIEDITDSEENVKDLLEFFIENKDYELRILRYNECNNSPYYESKKFIDIIKRFNALPNIKYQVSQGSEIKAACGQFIMEGLKSVN